MPFELTPYRRGLIASVKIAQKDMGLEDDVYRELLGNLTGQRSATTCSNAQLTAVLAEFRAKGWQPRPRAEKKQDPRTPLRRKIRAQVLGLDRTPEYADGILRRMYGEAVCVATATRAQLSACIAALTRQQQRAHSA